MVFSSLEFIFIFLPIFFIVYSLTAKRFKNTTLFFASILFYAYGTLDKPIYLAIFVVSIAFNYIVGRFIYSSRQYKDSLLILGIYCNIFMLFVFKYINFFLSGIFSKFFPELMLQDGRVFDISLPIGVSFYTFQAVSYLIDIYRGTIRADKSFVNFGMYISMFPQLIAGPIVTYAAVEKQIHSRSFSLANMGVGSKTFIFGLGLKVLLANQLGAMWRAVEDIGYDSISTALAWLAIVARSFQIYFDFFGYSLMAIGLGYMLGFKLPQNFDHPYTARTMTDFWRKWHITLGTWFREYIYIPMGGNRNGEFRTYFNLFVVWCLTGLWHGAGLNFIAWGILLFVLIAVEKAFILDTLREKAILGHLYMMFFVPISWVFFSIDKFSDIGIYLSKLFPFWNIVEGNVYKEDYIKYISQYWIFLVLGVLFSSKLPYKIYSKIKNTIVGQLILIVVFCLSIYAMYKGLDDPFLYFRF